MVTICFLIIFLQNSLAKTIPMETGPVSHVTVAKNTRSGSIRFRNLDGIDGFIDLGHE